QATWSSAPCGWRSCASCCRASPSPCRGGAIRALRGRGGAGPGGPLTRPAPVSSLQQRRASTKRSLMRHRASAHTHWPWPSPPWLRLERPGTASASVSRLQCRIDPDGLVVVPDGLVVVPLGPPGVAAAYISERVLRVEPDGLVVVPDRLIVLLPGVPGIA